MSSSDLYLQAINDLRASTKGQVTKQKFKSLEDTLNSFYYPKGPKTIQLQQAEEYLYQKFLEEVNERVQIALGGSIGDYSSIGLGDDPLRKGITSQILRNILDEATKARDKNIDQINYDQALANIVTEIQKLLGNIGEGSIVSNSKKQISNLSRVRNLINDLSNRIQSKQPISNQIKNLIPPKKEKNDVPNPKEELDYLLSLIGLNDIQEKYSVTNTVIGNILERAIPLGILLNSDNTVDQLTDDMIEQVENAIAGGVGAKTKHERFQVNSFIENSIGQESFIQKTARGNIKLTDENGAELINLSTAHNERQQKTDVRLNVNMTFKNGISVPKINISAKNWGNSSGDFGKTMLSNALQRTLGEENTLIWGSKIMANNKGLDDVLRLSRLAVVLDIIMGYGQTVGFADSVIINNRKDEYIKIYPMSEILHKSRINDFKVTGFYNDNIEKRLRQEYVVDKEEHKNKYFIKDKEIRQRLKTAQFYLLEENVNPGILLAFILLKLKTEVSVTYSDVFVKS